MAVETVLEAIDELSEERHIERSANRGEKSFVTVTDYGPEEPGGFNSGLN